MVEHAMVGKVGHVTVTGAEHHHLARVLRARPGDAITLFDGAGGELAARVVRVGRAETELSPAPGGPGGPAHAVPNAPRAGAPLVLLTAGAAYHSRSHHHPPPHEPRPSSLTKTRKIPDAAAAAHHTPKRL